MTEASESVDSQNCCFGRSLNNFFLGQGPFNIDIDGKFHSIQDGSILLSSIASCSNTSNPSVMLTAGLLAKKAVEAGLSVPQYVKRSLSPGSGIVTSYLQVIYYPGASMEREL